MSGIRATSENHPASVSSRKGKTDEKKEGSCWSTTAKVAAVFGAIIVFVGLLALLAISLQQAGALTNFFSKVSQIAASGASNLGTTAVAFGAIVTGFGGVLLVSGLSVIIYNKYQAVRARKGTTIAESVQS